MNLDCFVYPGWEPRIAAGDVRRPWMDASPERFAYRCLPLNIANAHGWELLSPCGFEAEWKGGLNPDSVLIRPDPGTPSHRAPIALFGQGSFTFHVEGLFRTPPGYNLWVGGPPNFAKDGIAPLGGVIETDWSPFTFTMNWRFTRPNQIIRFEENEPFCFFFPVERGLLEKMQPRIRPITDEPELKQHFDQWSQSRDSFQAGIAQSTGVAPAQQWQKFYFRGQRTDGSAGPPDHQSKLRVPEFEGAAAFHRETPAAGCPVQITKPRTDKTAEKFAWVLQTREQLRALSPELIERKADISADDFLHHHYAANRPLILDSELADWPALDRWSPEYLRSKVGAQNVEVQARRTTDANFERNREAHRHQMPFDQFIDAIREPGNDLYLTASNSAANSAALSALNDDLGQYEKLLDPAGHAPHGMLWIGPEGTFTPLHHDLTNNLLLQIRGRKKLLLVAPTGTPQLYNDHHVYSRIHDLSEPDIVQRFPLLNGLGVHPVTLEPGDALFIPVGWWHQATSLDFSISITHTNFRWPNNFHISHPHSG